MARKPKKSQSDQQPKSYDEFGDDSDGADEEVPSIDANSASGGVKSRDWRDVERYKEIRELKRRVGDDFELDDILDDLPRSRR